MTGRLEIAARVQAVVERACAAVAAHAVGMQEVMIASSAPADTLAVLEDVQGVLDVAYNIEIVGLAGRDEVPRACLERLDSSLGACAYKHSHWRLGGLG